MAHLIMIEYIEVAKEKEASFFWPNLYLFMGCLKSKEAPMKAPWLSWG